MGSEASKTTVTTPVVEVKEKIPDEVQYKNALCAMESGDDSAKTKVAWFMLSGRGGAQIDAPGAVCLLKERVEHEDAEAMWMLGMCKEFGIGTEKDPKQCLPLYESSARKDPVGKFFYDDEIGDRGEGFLNVGWWSL